MRVRRSSTLVLLLEHDQVVFHNFLAQKTFAANPTALEVLRLVHGWSDSEALHARLGSFSRSSIERAVRQLVEVGALIVEGSGEAERDAEYERSWLWGPFAGAYHFGTQGESFVSDEDSEAMLRSLAQVSPSPPLYRTNAEHGEVQPGVPRRGPDEPFRTMAARRTNRVMLDQPAPFEAISDCFLFSLAITATLDLPGIGELPLKMTPSGGARNPFEGYLLARRVEGLAAGVYHYSAIEHAFGRMGENAPPPFPPLLGDQVWTEKAAAVVLLVANFERTMWKYHDASAYRVCAMEAGHIAQNMILAATRHGLVGNPTALLAPQKLARTLRLGTLTQAPLYAVVLGHGAPFGEDPAQVAQAD